MSPSTEVRENREFASELKYLVTPAVADRIRDWAHPRLLPDPNGTGERSDAYQITSLYFDTAQFHVFHRQGSFGRSKYRIRRYGSAEVAFLERKLRTRGLLAKRRSFVPLEELNALTATTSRRDWTGRWFHRRLQARQLQPVCQVSYDRTARVTMTERGPIRLTLDTGLRAVTAEGFAFNESDAGHPVMQDQIILELKYRVAMPLLFQQLVEEFGLSPQSVSKYRLSVGALKIVPEPVPEPVMEPAVIHNTGVPCPI